MAVATSADREQHMAAWQARQRSLQVQQEALAHRQAELGQQQAAFGAQQAALGKRQVKASEQASRGMRKLLDEAIAKGIAQPVGAR
jgi:hypothetical protein